MMSIDQQTKLIPMEERYIAAVADLCDRSVGKGFYTQADWQRILTQPGHFCNLLTRGDGTLIGYNYNHLLSEADAECELKTPAGLLRRIAGAKPGAFYGICKSMGIEPVTRKAGHGYELLRHGIRQLYENGACSLWGSAWKHGNHIPMRGIFDHLRFHYLCNLSHVWYDVEGLECPACGQPRCICDAALFYQTREEWKDGK